MPGLETNPLRQLKRSARLDQALLRGPIALAHDAGEARDPCLAIRASELDDEATEAVRLAELCRAEGRRFNAAHWEIMASIARARAGDCREVLAELASPCATAA